MQGREDLGSTQHNQEEQTGEEREQYDYKEEEDLATILNLTKI